MRTGLAVSLAACLVVATGTMARGESWRHDWRLEDGLEHDSNPGRVEKIEGTPSQPMPPASWLARLVASGSLAAELGQRNTLALTGAFGAKWFAAREARGANVLVAQASGSDSVRVWGTARVAAGLAYYDVFQRRSREVPDFRSLTPSLRLDQPVARSLVVSAGAGYRWFTYKPDGAFSFGAPTAFLSIRQVLPGDILSDDADWEWSVGGSFEAREFEGAACTATGCGGDGARHRDHFWIAHAGWSRTGSWLLGSGAAVHVNRSNSYGEQLVRGLVNARAVVPLPGELSLSVRGELVLTRHRDPLTFLQPVAGLPSASIEDESRSTVRVELARVFERRFEIGARYVCYTSAPTSGAVDYRRQTVLFYFAFLDEP